MSKTKEYNKVLFLEERRKERLKKKSGIRLNRERMGTKSLGLLLWVGDMIYKTVTQDMTRFPKLQTEKLNN